MKIKLKENRRMEELIFNVKAITDAYDRKIDPEAIFYLLQDLNIASAQNNHSDLVKALNGLKEVIDSHENLFNEIRKLDDMVK